MFIHMSDIKLFNRFEEALLYSLNNDILYQMQSPIDTAILSF